MAPQPAPKEDWRTFECPKCGEIEACSSEVAPNNICSGCGTVMDQIDPEEE